MKAKMQKLNAQKLGDDWREIEEASGSALSTDEIRRCPRCRVLITMNGGCSHMICICGCRFLGMKNGSKNKESFQPMEEKYGRLIQFYNGMIFPSCFEDASQPEKANRAPILPVLYEEVDLVD